MREESLNVKGDCCCYCCCWRSKPTVKCLNRKSFHTLNLTLVLTRAREFSRLFYDCVSTEFSCGDLALTVLIYTHLLQFRNNFLHPGFLSCPFFPCNFFPRVLLIIYFWCSSFLWLLKPWIVCELVIIFFHLCKHLCFRMSIHLKALEICCDDKLLLQSKKIHIHTASDCNWVGLLIF